MLARQFACLVFPVAAIVFIGSVQGDTIAQYSFTDVTTGTLNRDATTVAPNVTAGSVTDAPIVFTHEMVVLSRATGIGYDTQPVLAAARAAFNESNIRDNVYFTFTVSANAGSELDLNSLTFNAARGGAATPRDYDIRSSLDGFATSLTGIVEINTLRPTFTPVSLDLSAAQFQNLTSPITFQFRFFTPGFSQNIDFDDITLNGTVAPAPASLAGDYNANGTVDAADYVLWRDNLGAGTSLPNDDTLGVGPEDYTRWKANFGNTSGSGAVVGFAAAVPEPATYALGMIALGICANLRRRAA